MRIFLLGHKGFLGSHLLPKLQTLGHDVITDLRYWDERYDVVINLAAKTHLRMEFDPQLIESNYILVDKVFKRSERILYASSCSAKYNTNPYAASKIWAEHLGEKHGNAVGFRFHNIYGPGNNKGIVWYLMQQPDGAKITIRGPELVRDYVYIGDVVDEILKHLKPAGMHIDLMELKKRQGEYSLKEMVEKAFNQNIYTGIPHIDILQTKGIVDVGTGVGVETMDLVNLYMKLSGKSFIIDVEEAGSNEPQSMVSNNATPNAVTLEEGFLKMINNEA